MKQKNLHFITGIILLFSVFLLNSCSLYNSKSTNILINIPNIINKTEESINKALKENGIYDNSTKTTKYKKGLLEIKFINNKAEKITVNLENYDQFSCKNYSNLLSSLNLPQKTPSFSNKHVTKWKNISNITEINCYPQGNKVFYLYIEY
jgi:hypothetical protein